MPGRLRWLAAAILALSPTLVSVPARTAPGPPCADPGATGQRCDDGNPCTRRDLCGAGTCAGQPVTCGDDDVCNGVETCDPATGLCRAGEALVCDDGDPCTVDEPCDPIAGCVIRRLPGLDFVRCRASGLLPIETCRAELPRRVRRPLARMQRVLDRTGRATSVQELRRTLRRLERGCHRAKRRLERALARRGDSDCLVRQRRALGDLCPDRSLVGPLPASPASVVRPG